MTVSVTERVGSGNLRIARDGKSSTATLLFTVAGAVTEREAINALISATPAVYGSRWQPPILAAQSWEVDALAPTTWIGTVRYSSDNAEPPESLDSIEFDAVGGTEHVSQGDPIASYVEEGWNPASNSGAIGISDDGVQGADIVVPKLEFTIQKTYDEVDPGLIATIVELTGTVNNAGFLYYAAGEVLFLGATGRRESRRLDAPWSLAFRFAVQFNRNDLTIGAMTNITKDGWDVASLRFETVSDSGAKILIPRVRQVDIIRPYKRESFGALGLP